jgi:hypothetical protein
LEGGKEFVPSIFFVVKYPLITGTALPNLPTRKKVGVIKTRLNTIVVS